MKFEKRNLTFEDPGFFSCFNPAQRRQLYFLDKTGAMGECRCKQINQQQETKRPMNHTLLRPRDKLTCRKFWSRYSGVDLSIVDRSPLFETAAGVGSLPHSAPSTPSKTPSSHPDKHHKRRHPTPEAKDICNHKHYNSIPTRPLLGFH